MKLSLTIFILFILLLTSTGASYAYDQSTTSAQSAKLASVVEVRQVDNRAEVLRDFLALYNSPLAPYAEDFVDSADRYNLDWRLVASIAGLESGFGKNIPTDSYNGWGWGIYGDNVKRFNSWEEGIETISKGLRENYLGENPESNPYLIGPKYAASPTWAQRVAFFMNKIEQYRVNNAKSTLALAL
ncbi:MAG: hypothetical protein A3A51_02030 [Candidatus Levybacteria bacterium RIFCSPLOWO2_01_FULL_39_10]|nr:MAG: hypothetical protein A3A51_02030 [Candidatus Levybacteria bacterium RIFCSPLOWO2_01_FULL_39_10]